MHTSDSRGRVRGGPRLLALLLACVTPLAAGHATAAVLPSVNARTDEHARAQ